MGEVIGVACVGTPRRTAHGEVRQRGDLLVLVEKLLGPVVERPAVLPRETVAEGGQLADGDVGIVRARGVWIRNIERPSLYRRPGQAGEGEGGHRGQRPQAMYESTEHRTHSIRSFPPEHGPAPSHGAQRYLSKVGQQQRYDAGFRRGKHTGTSSTMACG